MGWKAIIRQTRVRAMSRALLALAFGAGLVVTWQGPASACRGYHFWSTGADLSKLKAGEIVVKATLLKSYRGEQKHESIMGSAYGYIYHVQVAEVVGGTLDGVEQDLRGAKIFLRLPPSICEQYVPRNFTKESPKTLVLRKGASGLYDLVGGQE